jgi:hypothetical protein
LFILIMLAIILLLMIITAPVLMLIIILILMLVVAMWERGSTAAAAFPKQHTQGLGHARRAPRLNSLHAPRYDVEYTSRTGFEVS